MSERERTAEELRRENEALRDTLQNLDDGYYSVTGDGVIIEHNRAFNRILGVDAGRDMRGQKSPDFWRNADDRQPYLKELMAKGSVENFEANARRIDGSEMFVLLSAHVVKDASGRLARIEGTVRDVTERKRMEEELRRAFEGISHEKQLTDTIVNSMPGIFYTLDFTGRFVRWNSNFERVTGYGGEELAAMNALELFEGEDKQRIAAAIQEVAEKGESTVEAEITNKAGRRTPYLFTGMRAQIGGAPHLVGMGIDISERKRAEAELRIKNQVFEDSIASQSVADENGVITLVNPAFLRLWGYASTGEAIGKSVGSFFADPADATPVLEALAAHDAWEGRFLARRTDGSTFVSHGYATSLRNAKGELTGYQSTNLDVTRERESEVALQQSEEKYRSLFDNAEVGMYRSRLDGSGIIALNQRLADIFGYTKDEMLSSPATMRWANPAARDEMVRLLREMEELHDHEIDIVTKGGEIRTALASVKLFPREGYLEGTANDITERKRAQEALAISQERLLFATEGANLGIWNWNVVTGELIWSDRCKALFGIPLEETMSYPRFSDALHPDDRERTDKAVKDALDNHADFDIEYRSLWPDGSIHWLAATGRGFYDASGTAVRLEGVVQDIAARKRDEEALREANENLARSNQELEQFAYVASHDLQEPLRMVSSFTQLLAQRYEDKLDQDAKEFIGFAVDGANRMQRLIQDLLLYSRVATRGLPPAPLDAHDALGEAVSNLQIAIQETQALVTNGDLPTVLGDPTQIAQVFQNLIGNAIKFHRPGEPPRVHVSAERSAEQPGF
jgi:PAS domain S-box-containing protein